GEMHSDLEQDKREDVILDFKSGKINVLVATDIMARGIDIDDIQLVVNYDVPREAEDYVHRIGRTARADRDGNAITFISEKEIGKFKRIEKFLEKAVEKAVIPEAIGEGPSYIGTKKKEIGGRKGKKSSNPEKSAKSSQPKTNRTKRTDKAVGKPDAAPIKETPSKQNKDSAHISAELNEKPKRKRHSRHRRQPQTKPQGSDE
ncbi:MAG: DEAD/DEAH box helicase, partial [Muribaculaceae bacterium]|nr:DEAD/DEAH box helicase [Muribaculaceae bacterium]